MISSHTVSIYTEPCQKATTKKECETFARDLGLSDTIVEKKDIIINKAVPSGCYYKPSNSETRRRLYFNTAVIGNTSPCTETRKCVCKNGLKTSGKIKQELISNHFPWKLVDYKQR